MNIAYGEQIGGNLLVWDEDEDAPLCQLVLSNQAATLGDRAKFRLMCVVADALAAEIALRETRPIT